jgi:hypothetical protein
MWDSTDTVYFLHAGLWPMKFQSMRNFRVGNGSSGSDSLLSPVIAFFIQPAGAGLAGAVRR